MAGLRRELVWFPAVILPLAFVAIALDRHTRGDWSNSIGRLSFLVAMAMLATFLFRLVRPGAELLTRTFLQGKGLLVREPNEADRRSFLIRVTDAGARTATELREMLERLEREVMARVSDRDMEGFDAVMSAVADVTQVELRPKEREDEG